MKNIHARNVNEAYTIGLRMLEEQGQLEMSRAGPVKTMPVPVTTSYQRPYERVLFDAKRDCNPFFHLLESLWMLAGRNDVDWISEFSSNIVNYSDDGKTFHGAYGHRWRNHFGKDQLYELVTMLKRDPETRRAGLGMWDPRADCNAEGKDFPCNMQIVFRWRSHGLDMTVYNRSNDAIWGAYGANAVHMSMLHEWMSTMIGAKQGIYYQVSNDFHAYVDVFHKVGVPQPMPDDPYSRGEVCAIPIIDDIERWNKELFAFMEHPLDTGFTEEFFAGVARPMVQAWRAFKSKNLVAAQSHTQTISAPDWRKACNEWIIRRVERAASRSAGPTLAYDANAIRPKRG